MLTGWSTLEIPGETKFGRLQELLDAVYMPAVAYPMHSPTVSGYFRSRNIGRCTIFEVTADGHGIRRNRTEINSSDAEFYSVKYLRSGSGELEQEGRRSRFEAGDICVLDSRYPYRLEFADGFSLSSFIIPNDLLYPRLVNPRAAMGGVIPSDAALSPLLRAHMDGLIELKDDANEVYSATLNDTLCGLVAITLDQCNQDVEANQKSANYHRYLAVIEYVRNNLSDPQLSPTTVAAACGISVRYLHKLFEPQGCTFGKWLLKLRLERCREQIADPRFADKKLTVIPYDWGFNNLSHFIRAFRQEYGLTPRDYRKQAQSQWVFHNKKARAYRGTTHPAWEARSHG